MGSSFQLHNQYAEPEYFSEPSSPGSPLTDHQEWHPRDPPEKDEYTSNEDVGYIRVPVTNQEAFATVELEMSDGDGSPSSSLLQQQSSGQQYLQADGWPQEACAWDSQSEDSDGAGSSHFDGEVLPLPQAEWPKQAPTVEPEKFLATGGKPPGPGHLIGTTADAWAGQDGHFVAPAAPLAASVGARSSASSPADSSTGEAASGLTFLPPAVKAKPMSKFDSVLLLEPVTNESYGHASGSSSATSQPRSTPSPSQKQASKERHKRAQRLTPQPAPQPAPQPEAQHETQPESPYKTPPESDVGYSEPGTPPRSPSMGQHGDGTADGDEDAFSFPVTPPPPEQQPAPSAVFGCWPSFNARLDAAEPLVAAVHFARFKMQGMTHGRLDSTDSSQFGQDGASSCTPRSDQTHAEDLPEPESFGSPDQPSSLPLPDLKPRSAGQHSNQGHAEQHLDDELLQRSIQTQQHQPAADESAGVSDPAPDVKSAHSNYGDLIEDEFPYEVGGVRQGPAIGNDARPFRDCSLDCLVVRAANEPCGQLVDDNCKDHHVPDACQPARPASPGCSPTNRLRLSLPGSNARLEHEREDQPFGFLVDHGRLTQTEVHPAAAAEQGIESTREGVSPPLKHEAPDTACPPDRAPPTDDVLVAKQGDAETVPEPESPFAVSDADPLDAEGNWVREERGSLGHSPPEQDESEPDPPGSQLEDQDAEAPHPTPEYPYADPFGWRSHAPRSQSDPRGSAADPLRHERPLSGPQFLRGDSASTAQPGPSGPRRRFRKTDSQGLPPQGRGHVEGDGCDAEDAFGLPDLELDPLGGTTGWSGVPAVPGKHEALYKYDAEYIARKYEVLNMRVVQERGRTGFEESKDFPICVGDLIAGRYQVMDMLGSAAFSKAVQALDVKTNTLVCLKIIRNNKDYFDQSLDEIKLLKYVNEHDPHDEHGILRLYDYFYFKEHLFLVCELLRANLYEFQKYTTEKGEEPYFTLPRLQSIAAQVLQALVFLHSLHLIHSDLKPENILIKSYSRCEVKVIDLGSSCFVTDHLSSYVQSRSYRAPEVILGLPYQTKIDIWSLGCILAELVSGYVLFQNDSLPTMLARMEGILGRLPRWMLAKGRYTRRYYTRSWQLYEANPQTGKYEILRPKSTSLRYRIPGADNLFYDFLEMLLTIDPNRRPSAEEALQHPWLRVDYSAPPPMQ